MATGANADGANKKPSGFSAPFGNLGGAMGSAFKTATTDLDKKKMEDAKSKLFAMSHGGAKSDKNGRG